MQFVPYVIYTHVREFIEYQGYKPAPAVELDVFVTNIKSTNYHLERADARDASDTRDARDLLIIILMEYCAYATSKPRLDSMFSKLKREIAPTTRLILVAGREFFVRANLSRAAKARGAEVYPYTIFACNQPEYICNGKYHIMNEQEADDMLAREFTSRACLPIISASEAMIIWSGGKPGQIVMITGISETAGYAVIYRLII